MIAKIFSSKKIFRLLYGNLTIQKKRLKTHGSKQVLVHQAGRYRTILFPTRIPLQLGRTRELDTLETRGASFSSHYCHLTFKYIIYLSWLAIKHLSDIGNNSLQFQHLVVFQTGKGGFVLLALQKKIQMLDPGVWIQHTAFINKAEIA